MTALNIYTKMNPMKPPKSKIKTHRQRDLWCACGVRTNVW